jgi:hypothetical protein
VQAALAIESLGIVRFTYVVVAAAEKCYFLRQSAATAGLEDSPLTHTDHDLGVGGTVKVVCSTLLTLTCAGFLFYSIVMGYSIVNLPGVLLLLLLLAAYVLVFYCEGKGYTPYFIQYTTHKIQHTGYNIQPYNTD